MKKYILLALVSIFYSAAIAQQNVGVGTTTPASKLDVNGSLGTAFTSLGSGTLTLDQTNSTVLASPSTTINLPVASTATNRVYTIIYNGSAGGAAVVINAHSGDHIGVAGVVTNTSLNVSEGTVILQGNGSTWFATVVAASSGSGSYIQNQTSSDQTAGFRITGNGTIETAAIMGSGEGTATVTGGTLRAPNSAGTNAAGGTLNVTAGNGTGNQGSGNIVFKTAPVGSSGTGSSSFQTNMTITNGGNIGIGSSAANTTNTLTIQPAYEGVFGSSQGSGISIKGPSSSTDVGFLLGLNNSDNSSAIWDYDNNYMRFGTNNKEFMRLTADGNHLQINPGGGTVAGTFSTVNIRDLSGGTSGITVQNPGSANGVNGMFFGLDVSNTLNAQVWNTMNGSIEFGTNNTQKMVITNSGNVGIGTSLPGSTLQVIGSFAANWATKVATISTNSFSIASTDYYVALDATSTVGGTFTLPAGGSSEVGRLYIIKNATTTKTLSVLTSSALQELIDGATSVSIAPGSSVTLINNGTAWSSGPAVTIWNVTSSDAATGAATAWSTVGNTGTTPSVAAIGSPVTAGSNFIGTNDNKDLVIATNNGTNTYERIRVTSGGNVGIAASSAASPLSVGGNGNALYEGYFIQSSTTSGEAGLYAQGAVPTGLAGVGYGVRGFVPSGSGYTYGVYGDASGGTGTAGRAYGVYGQAGGATSGTNYGVYGTLLNGSGTGNGAAIYGLDLKTGFTSTIPIPGNYAGWFDGNIDATGTITIGSGEASSSPVGSTLRAPAGAGSNITGGSLTIAAGDGTGNAGSGSINFQTAAPAASSSTANTIQTVAQITNTGIFAMINDNTQGYPPYSSGGAPAFSWNFTGGNGEAVIWNNCSAGSPRGIDFRQMTSASASTLLMRLDGSGNANIYGTATIAGATTLSALTTAGIVTNSSTGVLSTALLSGLTFSGTTLSVTPASIGGWGVSGNSSGVSYPGNFIGTTGTDVGLLFKVNGTVAGRIEDGTGTNEFNNTAFGYGTMPTTSTSTSNGNSAFGYNALHSNVAGGNSNAAMGGNALFSNQTGTNNAALGSGALYNNVSGTQITGVGYLAAYYQTGAANNTAVGAYALLGSTTPANNTGTANTAIGVQSGYGNTTGSSNVFVGVNSGYGNTSGGGNTFVGPTAGYTGASGVNGNTTGSNNTFVGNSAGAGSTTQLTNATAIGYNATVSQSNSLVLGNGVNVGIGTSTPGQALSVVDAGNGNVYSGTFAVYPLNLTQGVSIGYCGISEVGTNGNNAMYLNAQGTGGLNLQNVGTGGVSIGTSLAVTGAETIGTNLSVSGTTTSGGEMIGTLASGSGQFRAVAGNYGIMFRNDGTTTYFLLTASGTPYGGWNGLRPLYIDDASGNVTMGQNLAVSGNETVTGSFQTGTFTLVTHTGATTSSGHLNITASCAAGGTLISGGCWDSGDAINGGAGNTALVYTYPSAGTTWNCDSRDIGSAETRTLTAYAICTK